MAHFQVSQHSLTPSRPAPSPSFNPSNALANVGYSSSFTASTSPSASPYAYNYSGIGGAPTRGNPADDFSGSSIIRSGTVSIKEDGFASWLWKAKWLVLRDQSLSIHKNEVGSCAVVSRAILESHLSFSPRHSKPSSHYGISRVSSEQISNPIACILRQGTENYGFHSRVMRRFMDGKTISISVLSWV